MTFTEFATHMYPYWLMGLFMLWITFASGNKDILRIEKPVVARWTFFLICLSIYRFFSLRHLPGFENATQSIRMIPWQATLTVFWEDACHAIPLALLKKLIGEKWYTIPVHVLAMGFVMLSFASGHLYQGLIPAIFLSAYIPFSVSIGQKRGFGTMMINHTLYDLFTVLTLKLLVG